MRKEEIKDTIIKTAICRYGGIREYQMFICTSTIFPGSGDYEDGPEIYEDREIDCYCIWIEDMIDTDNICASAGYYETLSDAISALESSADFERWID